MPELPIGKLVRIRDCGFDEIWLQDQIVANPTCLQLGDLEVIDRERTQASGGRLDILLKDPEDDSMYEVEIMLGDTDESHIIRTIEYWTREKRKWPQRQHFPVLVAEGITRRFFDVIQVVSHAIPMIAIQVSVIEANGNRVLSFHKVLDTYEEPEEVEGDYQAHDEAYWVEKASWTNETAKALLRIVQPLFPQARVNYVKNYISILANPGSRITSMWLHKRAAGKSLLNVWIGEQLMKAAKPLLDAKGIPYTVRKNHTLRITTDMRQLEENSDVYKQLGELVRQAAAG